MSVHAIRLQQMRHLRDQLRACLASWPAQTKPTRARIARVSWNVTDLGNEMRSLAIRMIEGPTHGH